MNYIMSNDEFFKLISASKETMSPLSPAVLPKNHQESPEGSNSEQSSAGLQKIGLFENGALTSSGKAVTSALLSPERLVETVNVSVTDGPVVSYCYKNGFWSVLLHEYYHKLVSILSPISPNEIKAFAEKSLLNGIAQPDYESFQLSLAASESVVFELSQIVIAQRFEKLGRALNSSEQGFTAYEIFSDENLLQMSAILDILGDKREQVLCSINNGDALFPALETLIKKGVLSVQEETECGMRFVHTSMAKKWLMADATLDKIIIKSVYPEKSPLFYKTTKTGLLHIYENNESIIYESKSALDLSFFDN